MSLSFKPGDSIAYTNGYGERVTGKLTMIGQYTGKPTQMRRADNGKLQPIMGGAVTLIERKSETAQ